MRQRATAIAVALGLAVAAFACSNAESNVVNQYFTALQANDTNTLTSFAMVAFDQKVDDWKVTRVGPETRTPVTLPDLVKKQNDLEAELAANAREARTWGNDLTVYPKLDQVRELDKAGKKIPASLEPIHEKWTAFNDKDRELKKAVAEAKSAVAREKHNTQLSVGSQWEDTIEQMKGEVVSKEVDVNLTIGGQVQPYVVSLHKYELQNEGGGPRMVSRWVVQSITPKQ
jgi:DNA polymerase III gamma/tau subunit